MKFVCDRCQTRYSIADEKVRQKILRIRCKTCGNVIVVQGERIAAAGDAPAAATASKAIPGAARPATSAPASIPPPRPAATSAPKAIPAPAGRSPSLSTAAQAASSALPKPLSAPAHKTGLAGPPPPPPPGADLADVLGGRAEWYLAVGGVRSGPFSRVEASRRVLAADPGKVVHVWKDGMNGWKPAEEVSVIARELSLLRSPPPPPPVHESVKSPVLKTPPPAAKPARMPAPERAFPGRPLDVLADGTTERMDVDAGSDSGPFEDSTTKKGAELQSARGEKDEVGSFADITTKKGKNIRKLIRETEASSSGDAAPKKAPRSDEPEQEPSPSPTVSPIADAIVSSSSSASLPAPISTPLSKSAAVAHAVETVPVSSDLGGLAGVMLAVAEPESDNLEPEIFPGASAPPPSLAVVPAETEKPRPGMKYLLAAGIIVVLVLLIALVSFRMDSHKVPVEPELPQAKAVVEPTVVVEEPKPTESEPQPVVAAVDERPTPTPRGGGKRGAGKTVKQVGPAPMPSPPSRSPERPVPSLSGRPGTDSRPNPFDESKAVSQAQIGAVVRNKVNQAALKACYERALKMDNHLTSGRIDVTVSIGMSGIVQHVVVNAPSSFILVEPCIKTAVRRWVFPPSSEEYATNFPLIMQGGM